MNLHAYKRPLIAIGLLTAVGAVGAQTYYTHELARRVAAYAAGTPVAPATPAPSPSPSQSPSMGWDPWTSIHGDMMRLQTRMDRMFDDAFRDFHGMPPGHMPTGHNAAGASQPGTGQVSMGQVTLEDQDGNYLVKADIPGATENDIDVNLDGRLLSISSQTQGEEQQTGDNGQVIGQESYASSFQQAFTLPGPVNASAMHTQFQNGVLTVTIPKA